MEVQFAQQGSQYSQRIAHSIQMRRNDDPSPDQLIYGGGDDSGWFGNLLGAIADFLCRLFCYPLGTLDNQPVRNYVDCQDRGAWGVNLENISAVSKPLVLPEDTELEKISIKDIKKFFTSCLGSIMSVNNVFDLLENPGTDAKLPALLKYLRAIVYKFQTGNLPADKKQEICIRLRDAFQVCSPTWVRTAKTICEEFYSGKKNGEVEKTLLQLIEQYKSEILIEQFEEVNKKYPSENFHWNITNRVRNEHGGELGLDQSISRHDSCYVNPDYVEANECVRLIKEAFLEQYRDVNRLVAAIQTYIVKDNIKFFDDLVTLIEEKNGLGNADAKKYVIEHLYDRNDDATVITIRPEAVYLLLQSIHIVI